jgi:hypothetical protein
MSVTHSLRYVRILVIFTVYATICMSGCMRLDPDHPYDPDSPPEFRAPASLISTIFTPQAPEEFDYSVFLVKLTASEYDGVYTRRPGTNGAFRFEGLPPGLYSLSVTGEIEDILFGIEAEEVLLPVGERVTPTFYRIDKLE